MRYRVYIILTSLLFLSFFNRALSQVQPKTFRQIQLLLQEKGARSPAQRKIDSRLLQAYREKHGQQMVTGVDLRPAKINTDTQGNLKVDIKAAVTDELISKIEASGGKIIYSSPKYNTIRAQVNLSMVETIAAYPGVKFVEPAVRSITVGTPNPNFNRPLLKPVRPSFEERSARIRKQLLNYLENHNSSRPYTGSVTSQGDRAHRADDTRNTYGYAGQGIRIGVLSDSYNAVGGAPADILNGDLPGPGNPLGNTTPVKVLEDFSDGEDEGRAMLQIVHDLAPKAQLFFATADNSEASFATNIQALRSAPNNCDIIIDDVFYFDEPAFQDGTVAQAVNAVTASGALYFSSAGNEGSVEKNTAGYYEGDFNDSGSSVFTPDDSKSGTIHNFGTIASPINGDIITKTGFAYTLTWADPIGASNNDYDLFLVDAEGFVKASSTNIQDGFEDPYEEIDTLTLVPGDRLVVFKTEDAQPRAFAINTFRGNLTVVTTGQTHGHSAAADAFSVAATPAAASFSGTTRAGPYPAAFSVNNQVESFSSDGPRRIFYNGDGTAITPGNFLFKTNGGNVRNKPDITAADGVATTLERGEGLNPFYGTSAAAPHAGAIAALLKSANPTLTATQIRTIITSTALDIESPGYDNQSGFGIVQAFQAMQLLNPLPSADISLGIVTSTEGTFSNGNGRIDPGELGKLTVQLMNSTIVPANNVTAILTTKTPGVTITQDSANYGIIADSSNVTNTATPFQFGINSSVPCGTIITFTLTVTFANGIAPQVFLINVTIGAQPWTNISNNLGVTIPTDTGFVFSTGIQTGRITRNAPVSVCGTQKITPVIFTTSGARVYDAYKFVNSGTSNQCVTVTMNATNGLNMYAVAYNNSGYLPFSPTTNYLADQGASGSVQTFGFTAPAGQAFTIVVHELNVGSGVDSFYTLNVGLSNCTASPACSPVNFTDTLIARGDTNAVYKQSFTASGGSGAYIFSLTGTLPAGLSFSGNTISGTPKQVGSFPIVVTATDITGCPMGVQNDTLVITAEVPVTYVFNGDGNWTDATNWLNNSVPPATLIPGSSIIIDPLPAGQCVLNIPYTLSPNCFITVNATKNFVVQGNLTIHQ